MVKRYEDETKRLKVVNLWAGPGAGKSTTAASLFALMKHKGFSVELVTEYAKEMVYADRVEELKTNQLGVLYEQDMRLRRLKGKVTWVINDSPLPLSLIYRPLHGLYSRQWLEDATMALWHDYENYNVTVTRVKPYVKLGRYQAEDEARKLDQKIEAFRNNIVHPMNNFRVDGTEGASSKVLAWLETQGAIPYGSTKR